MTPPKPEPPGWLSSRSKYSTAPIGEPSSPPPGWLSRGSKYSTGPIGGMEAAEPMQSVADPKWGKIKEWMQSKAGKVAVDEGIEMLPYWLRRPIKIGRKMSE